jgi:hypothetical protein
MTRGSRTALVAASAVYAALVFAAARQLGANYEEVVPYVLSRLDIRDSPAAGTDGGSAPRFVTSGFIPRLAFEPTTGVQFPLLNQLYMTDHLSYGGVALAAAGIDRLWAARLWHALFGMLLLWLLHDIVLLLGLGRRTALVAVAIAATSLPFTFMYSWARFDESLPSWGSVVVLWAALRYGRDGRRRWIWVGVWAAALALSAKVTASWPLLGLAAAAFLAGWKPPPVRDLALPALTTVPLFGPILGFALVGPATSNEAGRRIGYIGDIFTTDAIPGWAANLVDYLGNWGGILSEAIRGADAGRSNLLGWLLVGSTLVWLVVRAFRPGPVPRRRRLETQMLAVVAVVFSFVTLFYRQHRDYEFVLLVPLDAVAIACFLDWCAQRFLDRRLPAWAAGLLVCALPVGLNMREQLHLHDDLLAARNAMFHQGVQRASAAWLAEHGVRRPLVVTFYAAGTYELLTDGAVRPVYAFPLLRHANDARDSIDLVATWRALLADAGTETRYAVLPLGENPIEAQHFDEPAIRNALLQVTPARRVAVFGNQSGDPLLEVWEIAP